MPRQPRFCPAGYPAHVIQRGVNRAVCFTSNEDMAAYAASLSEGALRYGVAIHAWVFMSNHVHLLVTPSCDDGVSRLMRHIGRHYVQPFNFKYARTGPLFEGRFKSTLVQDTQYLLHCTRYIELNPIRAGMTTDPGDYLWSSYKSHAFGKQVQLWTPHEDYLPLGETTKDRTEQYRALVSQALSVEVIQKNRHCVNTGLVLGKESFRDQVKALRS
ncbi:MAG: transposase [Gammaproteobacteria bacterium]|jgi:putative transposase|nr:transposase [Gammaproteobacteria bacterium]MBT7879963.1 transposase [Gammaproteobacteria bacterium]